MKESIQKRTIRTDAKIHKRTPQRPASRPSDIYISSKTKANVVVRRVRQLMVNEHFPSVTLHGMGASIFKTISIAQAAQNALHDQISLQPTTGTVKLIDDVIPEDMNQDLESQTRMNSAIHITLVPKQGLKELQQHVAPITRKPSRNRKTVA